MCGLFGIINPTPKKINWQLVDILGIANDSRGGDSCGLFIDGRVNYGVKEQSFWCDWYHDDHLHKEMKEATILLGHCRKASVGGKDPDKAHPVCHFTEDGQIDFVMVHNGTIKNHTDLAKKFLPEENTTGMSDTQVMAKIFYNHGYDVLDEYTGAAVFVTVDYRSGAPVTRVFQGWSKEHYTDKAATPERPFYFIFNKGSYVFSSIGTFLMPFVPGDRFKGPEVYMVPENTLCELEPTGLKKIQKYDRSDKVQSGYYGTTYTNPTPAGMTTSTKNGGTTTATKENVASTKIHGIFTHSVIPATKDYITYNAIADLYYEGTQIAHGDVMANIIGKIGNKESSHSKHFYFWNGVLLCNKDCFDVLSSIAKIKGVTPAVLEINEPNLVHFLSPYPWRNAKQEEFDLVESTVDWSSHPYSGVITRVFDMFSRTYINGKATENEHFIGYLEAFDNFTKIIQTTNVQERIAKIMQKYAGQSEGISVPVIQLPLAINN